MSSCRDSRTESGERRLMSNRQRPTRPEIGRHPFGPDLRCLDCISELSWLAPGRAYVRHDASCPTWLRRARKCVAPGIDPADLILTHDPKGCTCDDL